MKHELKTWPVAFELALSGAKMFEIRVNDRAFQVGDILRLREYELETDHYTGRELLREVTCVVFGWGLPDGVCALGLKNVDAAPDALVEAAREAVEWLPMAPSSDAAHEAFMNLRRALAAAQTEKSQ